MRYEHQGRPWSHLAFMGISLAITATGTARFSTAMGYSGQVGYAVGAAFDLAKAFLPVVILMLFSRSAFGFAAAISSAWLGLAAYSCLATHATVTTAIAAIECTGAWTMESRTHAKAELAAIEEQIEVLVQPKTPRPSDTLRAILASERVPGGVWRDSQECRDIRESKYFQVACAKFLELRRELAAAEDYERLTMRASELRQVLASSPIMATSDPLPEAFNATLGRALPLDGRIGVALLLTFVIEIVSCLGIATLRVLREEPGRDAVSTDEGALRPERDQGHTSGRTGRESPNAGPILAASFRHSIPQPSGGPGNEGFGPVSKTGLRNEVYPPSNVIPMVRERGRDSRSTNGEPCEKTEGKTDAAEGRSLVAEFARARLHSAEGRSLGASELRVAYEAWCAANGWSPISQQRLGAELAALGFAKWKSGGLIRYRDLQLASSNG